MANPTTNYGFVLPTSSDLVTDLPADFDIALQGVDTRLKALQPGTTLGDLAYSSATANTNTRLAVGSTGQVLTVSGGVPAWATPAGGGKLLQVVSATTTTSKTISNDTYTDTNLTATITPTASTSKILVLISQYYTLERSGNGVDGGIRLLRGATTLLDDSNKENLKSYAAGATTVYFGTSLSLSYLDSPATTSATTYKTQGANLYSSGQAIIFQRQSVPSTITLMEIGA
jgi:hypothetical protein